MKHIRRNTAYAYCSPTDCAALYMTALVAWRHNPAIRAFCERLKANGKNNG